jgi:hypothetical protein
MSRRAPAAHPLGGRPESPCTLSLVTDSASPLPFFDGEAQGNVREYAAIRPLQSLKELGAHRTPADLLTRTFGTDEGGLIFRTGNEAIVHIERRIVAYR